MPAGRSLSLANSFLGTGRGWEEGKEEELNRKKTKGGNDDEGEEGNGDRSKS